MQTDPMFGILTYAALAVAVVALIITIAAFFTQRGPIQEARYDVKALKKELAAAKKENEGNAELIEQMKEQIARLEAAQDNAAVAMETMRRAAPASVAPALATPAPVITDEMRYCDFVAAYNERRAAAAAAGDEFDRIDIRDAFLQEFHLRGLACANATERMQNPALPIAFAETPAANADFWAFSLTEGRYAVVPSFGDYTQDTHTQGGRDAFASDYTSGSCHTVIVDRPAVFQGLSTIEEKGQLRLS